MKIFLAVILLLILFIGVALSKTPKSNNEASKKYLQNLIDSANTHQVDNVEQKFLNLYSDFKKGATEEIIRKTYAETFYFNDTFRELDNIEELIPYIVETAAMVDLTTVEVLDVSYSGSDYYVRWVMEMKFDVKRKEVYSKSIGMSQLRFNQEGKIIFHQDFWDSTEGFYQHLPYIGYFIRKIRSKL